MDQRISIQLKCPNPLYEKWISELYENAVKNKSRSQDSLKLALDSIKRYPLTLNSGSECALLKGFGKNLCRLIDKKMQQNMEPAHQDTHNKADESKTNSNLNNKKRKNSFLEANNSKKRSKGEYIPGYRTGAYAILVVLLKNYKSGVKSLSKSTLQTESQLECDESMTKSKPGSYYTAWSAMSSLVTKGYVNKEKKRCVEYSLTESGVLLAERLLQRAQGRNADEDVMFNRDEEIQRGCSNDDQVLSLEDKPEEEPEYVLKNSEELNMEGCFEPHSFDVVLLVDKQETSGKSKKNDSTILELEKYKSLNYELRHLKVGDFTWVARHRVTKEELVLPHIVERKRMDDLAHSIKDGRFHEQKFRLRQCGIPNVIYLIESHGSNKHNIGLPLTSLRQAIANTRIQDGFATQHTASLAESIKFLAMMTKLMQDKYSGMKLQKVCKDNISVITDADQLHIMEFKEFNLSASKTKPLTVKELFIKQLLQLKGVSVEKALAITAAYPTPRRMMEAFLNCQHKPELLLASITYGPKRSKIGPAISKTLHRFFTQLNLT